MARDRWAMANAARSCCSTSTLGRSRTFHRMSRSCHTSSRRDKTGCGRTGRSRGDSVQAVTAVGASPWTVLRACSSALRGRVTLWRASSRRRRLQWQRRVCWRQLRIRAAREPLCRHMHMHSVRAHVFLFNFWTKSKGGPGRVHVETHHPHCECARGCGVVRWRWLAHGAGRLRSRMCTAGQGTAHH